MSCKKHSRVVGETLLAPSDWSASDLFSSPEVSEVALSESFGVPFRFNGWFTTMLQVVTMRFWHLRVLSLPLLPRIRIFVLFKRQSSKHRRSHGFACTCPLLLWVCFFSQPFLPRVTSELAALILLCVLQASFGGLACTLNTHDLEILQCVAVHGFAAFPAVPRLSGASIHQNVPNQRLPQPDFGAQANRAPQQPRWPR